MLIKNASRTLVRAQNGCKGTNFFRIRFKFSLKIFMFFAN